MLDGGSLVGNESASVLSMFLSRISSAVSARRSSGSCGTIAFVASFAACELFLLVAFIRPSDLNVRAAPILMLSGFSSIFAFDSHYEPASSLLRQLGIVPHIHSQAEGRRRLGVAGDQLLLVMVQVKVK